MSRLTEFLKSGISVHSALRLASDLYDQGQSHQAMIDPRTVKTVVLDNTERPYTEMAATGDPFVHHVKSPNPHLTPGSVYSRVG